MLPIVEGYHAIIINSKAGNDGKFVIVGKYIGKYNKLKMHDTWWEINRKLQFLYGGEYSVAPEYNLLRIDGYKEETKTKQKECVK